jgi:hypothetical protein
MPQLIERDGRVEIVSPMGPGMRVFLAVAGLFPFLAPYELLFRVDWNGYLNPFFAVALLVSLGAVAVGLFFLYGALAGVSSVFVFDARQRTFTCAASSILRPRRTWSYPFDELRDVDVRAHDWSDGPPTYALEVRAGDRTLETGTSASREEVESWRAKVRPLLGRA